MAEKKNDRFERLRRQANELLAEGEKTSRVDTSDSVQDIIHELQVHQAELEIQNEELVRAERERARLQHKYEDLYQHAPCGYVTLDGGGVLSRINIKAAELLGLNEKDLFHLSFTDYLKNGWQDRFDETRAQAAATGRPQSLELPLMSRSPLERWVQMEIAADQDKDGTVRQWRLILVDISKRKATEISLEEKEIMLREIHHRVKNNMQVISSLLSFQARELPLGETRSVLEQVKQRVGAMALVHEMLYHSDNLALVSFDKYIKTLIGQLRQALQGESDIRCEVDLEALRIPVHQGLPAGLIVNELFCNALEHAFQGRRRGRVRVNMQSSDDKTVRIEIGDDGNGLPDGFDWRNPETLGLRLVSMLTRQLNGVIDVDSSRRGTSFSLTFPLQS